MIVGDLVPESSDVWEMLLLLIDIYKIASAPYTSKSGTFVLKALIRDHHQLYLDLFGKRLLPKHHFIIHYPSLIRILGPLGQYSTMRKEGKHKVLKRWARACNNYQNIAQTVVKRHQEQQSYVFLLGKPLTCDTEVKDEVPLEFSSLARSSIVSACAEGEIDDSTSVASSVQIHSYEFKAQCMVLTGWNDDGPEFAQLEHIFIMKGSVHFLLQPWKTLYHNRHLQAYAIKTSETSQIVKRPSSLAPCRPFHIMKCRNTGDSAWYVISNYNIV